MNKIVVFNFGKLKKLITRSSLALPIPKINVTVSSKDKLNSFSIDRWVWQKALSPVLTTKVCIIVLSKVPAIFVRECSNDGLGP